MYAWNNEIVFDHKKDDVGGQWWTWEIMLKIFEKSCWVVEIFSCSSSAWLHYVVRRQTKETVLWLYSIDHWPLIIFWLFYWPLSIGYILIIFHWHWRLIVFWLYSINHSPLIIFLFKTGLKLYSIDNCPLIIFWLYSIDNWPAIVMVWL